MTRWAPSTGAVRRAIFRPEAGARALQHVPCVAGVDLNALTGRTPARCGHGWMGQASIELTQGVKRPAALRLLSDDRLARRAAEGDRGAFAVIFERHHQGLYRYCRAILRHDEDARDALQTTFTRAIAALDGDERSVAIKPWLYRIAHNEAISLLRRRRPADPLDLQPEIAGGDPGPHDRCWRPSACASCSPTWSSCPTASAGRC